MSTVVEQPEDELNTKNHAQLASCLIYARALPAHPCST